jgi:hypothetical protein
MISRKTSSLDSLGRASSGRVQHGTADRDPAQNGWKTLTKMLIQILRLRLGVLSLVILGALQLGCSPTRTDQTPDKSTSTQTPASPVPRTPFERDLQFIRNGQFAHIWVFSRQDGKPIDKDDAAYLRANAPQVVDWVTTDEGKRVIAGTNFDLEQGNMAQLRQRFVVEDYTGK